MTRYNRKRRLIACMMGGLGVSSLAYAGASAPPCTSAFCAPVASATATTGSNIGVNYSLTANPSGASTGAYVPIQSTVTYSAPYSNTTTAGQVAAIRGFANVSSSGINFNQVQGGYFSATASGTGADYIGTAASLYGIRTTCGVLGTAAYPFHCIGAKIDGPIINANTNLVAGLYIMDQTTNVNASATVTNSYAIVIEGNGIKNAICFNNGDGSNCHSQIYSATQGIVTVNGGLNANNIVVNGGTCTGFLGNGLCQQATNSLGFMTGSTLRWKMDSGGFMGSGNTGGGTLSPNVTSGTSPVFLPNNTIVAGIGADAAGDVSVIVNGGSAVELVRHTPKGTKYLGTIPTVSGTGTPTITTGSTDTAGELTGGTSATSIVVTFAAAKTSAPFCVVSGQTVQPTSYSLSTTAITIALPATTGAKFDYVCFQN